MFHKYESYSERKKKKGGLLIYAYFLCTTTNICVENKYGHWRKKNSTLFLPPPYFEALQRQAMWSTSGMYVGIIQMSLSGSCLVPGCWSGKEEWQPPQCVHATVLCTTSTFQSSSCWVCHWWPTEMVEHHPTDFIWSIFCMWLAMPVPESVLHSAFLWEGGNGCYWL